MAEQQQLLEPCIDCGLVTEHSRRCGIYIHRRIDQLEQRVEGLLRLTEADVAQAAFLAGLVRRVEKLETMAHEPIAQTNIEERVRRLEERTRRSGRPTRYRS